MTTPLLHRDIVLPRHTIFSIFVYVLVSICLIYEIYFVLIIFIFITINHIISLMVLLSFCLNEELAEKVNQFPVLYDKSYSHFHRKDIKSNACQKVTDDLEFENGEC